MEAEDLAIGNFTWCWNPKNGLWDTVIKINWKHLRNVCEQPQDDTYKPIIITNEWLLKFGFQIEEDYGDETYYCKNGFGVKIVEEDNFYFYKYNGSSYTILREINYVHQLQNIYYALTGEKLTSNI